jgi:hypothetical protein
LKKVEVVVLSWACTLVTGLVVIVTSTIAVVTITCRRKVFVNDEEDADKDNDDDRDGRIREHDTILFYCCFWRIGLGSNKEEFTKHTCVGPKSHAQRNSRGVVEQQQQQH